MDWRPKGALKSVRGGNRIPDPWPARGRPGWPGAPSRRAQAALAGGAPRAARRGVPVLRSLIEELWRESDAGAPARLQVYVSQLRKALGEDAGALQTRPG